MKANGIIFNGTIDNFAKIKTEIPLYYKLDLLKFNKSIKNDILGIFFFKLRNLKSNFDSILSLNNLL